jgi:tetratricopeptide (TPR) repeat protein
LYAAFSLLSLQATRNSHQFAAVVGTITAWNFGEWAAAVRRRRAERAGLRPVGGSIRPRLLAATAIGAALLLVGSGWFFKMTGEKRTLALGEEPLFFPHQAAQLAGRPEMPARFLSFHNGHASLFEYYHGPQRKVFTDPRLEVAGPDLFQRYVYLEKQIEEAQPGWQAQLDEMGRPVVLIDHEYNAHLGATFLHDPHWRCVWFDPIAAVFVHESATEAVRLHEVDFAARHFRPDPSNEPRTLAELTASAAAIRTYIMASVLVRGDLMRPLVWLGLDHAMRVIQIDPDSAEGWKLLGQIELFREPPPGDAPRYRQPFNPVLDLSIVRATYSLKRALGLYRGDLRTLGLLRASYEKRLMYESALPLADRGAAMSPANRSQVPLQKEAELKQVEFRQKLGDPPPTTWRNLSDLDQIVTALLAAGRVQSAAELLERANPPERADWALLDRMATMRLHLGEPARARELWMKAASDAPPAIPMARAGATYLVEGDYQAARKLLQQALESQPGLFEACYCLAVVEQDSGNAAAAYDLAIKAIKLAPDELSRAASRAIASGVARFTRRLEDVATGQRGDRTAVGSLPATARSL